MAATITTSDGFDVSSNSGTDEQLRAEIGATDSPPEIPGPETTAPEAPPASAASDDKTDQVDRTPTPRNADGTFAARPKNWEAKKDPQARIGQVRWDQAEAERRAIAAEAERDTLRRELEATRQPRAENRQPDSPRPKTVADVIRQPAIDAPVLSDAEFFTQWPDASTTDYYRYVARYELHSEQRETQRQQQQSGALSAIERVVAAGKAVHPDFESRLQATAQAGLSFGSVLSEIIATDPLGHRLAYELTTHHDDLRRLSALAPLTAAREAQKILSRLEAASSGSASRAPVSSKAQPPIQPVGSSAQVSDEPPDPDDLDLDRHVAYYNAKDRARRR